MRTTTMKVEGDGNEQPDENTEVLSRVFTYEEKRIAVDKYLRRVGENPEVVICAIYPRASTVDF